MCVRDLPPVYIFAHHIASDVSVMFSYLSHHLKILTQVWYVPHPPDMLFGDY